MPFLSFSPNCDDLSLKNGVQFCGSHITFLIQCSLFAQAQQVKELYKLVEHLRTSLRVKSAHCIIWNRNLPHFSPFHTDSFALNVSGS